jgi:hypothetical protein
MYVSILLLLQPGTNNPTVKGTLVDLRFPTKGKDIRPPDGIRGM